MKATENRRGGRIKGLFNVSCISVSYLSQEGVRISVRVRCRTSRTRHRPLANVGITNISTSLLGT